MQFKTITLYIWPWSKLWYSSIREFLAYREFTTGRNSTLFWHRAVFCPAHSYWPGTQARYPAKGTARRLGLCYAYCLNSRCSHPVSYSMGTGCSLPGWKGAEAWNWPPTLVPRLWTRGRMLPLPSPQTPHHLFFQGMTGTGCFIVREVKRVMTWMFAGVWVAYYLSTWKLVPSVSRIEPNKPELLKDTVNVWISRRNS
jgi:hypothetical protein